MNFKIPIKWRIFQKILTKINSYSYSERFFTKISNQNIFFIHIGANDGIAQDPIYKYAKNWKGILVEPISSTFEKLKKNYSFNNDVIFENIAISNYNGEMSLFAPAGNDTEWLDRIVSAVKDNNMLKNFELKEITVPCLTLNSLIEKHKVKIIDLLLIDVEGFEIKILESYDFKILPKSIFMEIRFFSYDQLVVFYEKMISLGYSIFPEKDNVLMILKTKRSPIKS